MKLLIASDLHGSAYNCRLLLEAFAREQADRLVLLGDLLYHGPRNPLPQEYDTKAVTALLNGMADKLLCVRGNCDSEVDQMVLNFPVLADYAFLSVDGVNICATHGHTYGPDNPPPLSFEVKPWGDEDSDMVVAGSKRVLAQALSLMAQDEANG